MVGIRHAFVVTVGVLLHSVAHAAPFHLMVETDPNPGGPNNLILTTYDSRDDLRSFDSSGGGPVRELGEDWSGRALASEIPRSDDPGVEGEAPIPEPAGALLFSCGLLVVARRRGR